jgi:hypothetical protein
MPWNGWLCLEHCKMAETLLQIFTLLCQSLSHVLHTDAGIVMWKKE